MSRSVGIGVHYDAIGIFMEAIAAIGLAQRQLKQLEDKQGHLCRVDFAVQTEKGELIGVRKGENGQLEMVAQDPQSPSTLRTIDRIKQSYSRIKVLNEVKKKGYQQVKEEKLPDGSIRIVVEKWR